MRRPILLAALLFGLLVGYVELRVPDPVEAQGGDAVYRSLRVQIPIERQYLEPQGLQDAAYDLLTADTNIMSSTYVTVLSAPVTVGEVGDAVILHVTGRFGWMESVLYVVDFGSPDELWRIDNATTPSAAVLEGSFPSGLSNPRGITSHGGALYVVDDGSPDELWRIDDATTPSGAVLEGSFPSGLQTPQGITSHAGALYVVNERIPEAQLWRIDNATTPSGAVLEGSFPTGLSDPRGITSHGGALYIVDNDGDELWRIDDATTPSGAVLEGSFPSGLFNPQGITSHGGALYIVDNDGDEVWRIDNATTPSGAVLEGSFPSGLFGPLGITSVPATAPCEIRIGRGATDIETVVLDSGMVIFDTSFVDAPPVGTHVYSVQMRTQSKTPCNAYRGGPSPMPSLLVESFYAGSIP